MTNAKHECAVVRPMIPEFVMGDLNELDARLVTRHVLACHACRRLTEHSRVAWTGLCGLSKKLEFVPTAERVDEHLEAVVVLDRINMGSGCIAQMRATKLQLNAVRPNTWTIESVFMTHSLCDYFLVIHVDGPSGNTEYALLINQGDIAFQLHPQLSRLAAGLESVRQQTYGRLIFSNGADSPICLRELESGRFELQILEVPRGALLHELHLLPKGPRHDKSS